MTPELYRYMCAQAPRWAGKTVVEIGARSAKGQEHLHLKPILLASKAGYVGIDLEPGEHVDFVEDMASPYAQSQEACNAMWSADIVICLETLEHMPMFWTCLAEIATSTATECIISVPTFGFPYHAHPVDCYRFSQDSAQALMTTWEIQEILFLPDGFGNQTMVLRGTR
jgi:hypothetical protein